MNINELSSGHSTEYAEKELNNLLEDFKHYVEPCVLVDSLYEGE